MIIRQFNIFTMIHLLKCQKLGGENVLGFSRNFIGKQNPVSQPGLEKHAPAQPEKKEEGKEKPGEAQVKRKQEEFKKVCKNLVSKIKEYDGYYAANDAKKKLELAINRISESENVLSPAQLDRQIIVLRNIINRIPGDVAGEVRETMDFGINVLNDARERFNSRLNEIAANAKEKYKGNPETESVIERALGQALARNNSYWYSKINITKGFYGQFLAGLQAGDPNIGKTTLEQFDEMAEVGGVEPDSEDASIAPVANIQDFRRELDGKVVLKLSRTVEAGDAYLSKAIADMEKEARSSKYRIADNFYLDLEAAKKAYNQYYLFASENRGPNGRNVCAYYFAQAMDAIARCKAAFEPAGESYTDSAYAAIDATRRYDEDKNKWENIEEMPKGSKYEMASYKRGGKRWRVSTGTILYNSGEEDEQKPLLGTRAGTVRAGTELTVDSDRLLKVPGLGFVVHVTLPTGETGYILRSALPRNPIPEKEGEIEKLA
jgi:hypothetical protein